MKRVGDLPKDLLKQAKAKHIDDLRRVDEIEAEKSGIGYHIQDIPKGVFGEPSKIFEEAHEFIDASQQGCAIMAVLELSDLYGAMQGYLEKYHPTITMDDIAHMSDITQRAFKNGHRD